MPDAWGVEATYLDAAGDEQTITDDAVAALRAAIGQPEASTAAPLFVSPGRPRLSSDGELRLEDGTTITLDGALPADVPVGYHRLTDDDGERLVVVSPGRCHLPDGWRAWGWAVQLYAARSRSSWGIGDLRDLRSLSERSRDDLGAGFALVNPLHATAPVAPQQPSPYYPATRRFWNPIYLAVGHVPGASAPEVATEVASAAAAGQALLADRRIHRDAVWTLKERALEAIWSARIEDGEFHAWRADQGDALEDFATWCALTEEHDGAGWRDWPASLHDHRGAAVTAFREAHHDRISFFAWLQWLVDRQLRDAAGALAVVQDLPIGVDPNGADAWVWQDVLAEDVTVGAPPDEFNTRGQDWGLPPFVPWKLRAAEYRPFIETIRATIGAGGGLRIDHVMGLFRLWWVPRGAGPAEGGYVRYPADDLLDIVALESHRAQAMVVGEDLGTVEPGVRETLAERTILSYRLLWFEEDDPARWPQCAMAAVSTHDLPTVAGLWNGSDLDEQRELGLEPNEASTKAIHERLAERGDLDDGASDEEAVRAAYEQLAGAPAVLLTATLDDGLAVAERPNIPGADGERANWSLALPTAIDDVTERPLVRSIARSLGKAVR